jgi:hypothetical protein
LAARKYRALQLLAFDAKSTFDFFVLFVGMKQSRFIPANKVKKIKSGFFIKS